MNPHLQFAVDTFGVRADAAAPPPAAILTPPQPGEILAVVGPSGAGKTRALNALAAATPLARTAHELTPAELERPVLALFDSALPSQDVLRCLARIGLADARLWTQTAGTLSAGERRRLEIARALIDTPARGLLVLDEPDAHLDDLTARVLAIALRRIAGAHNIALAVSTHRRDLLAWYAPQRICEIAGATARELELPRAKSSFALLAEIDVVPGRAGDYDRFAHWHYLGDSKPGPCRLALLAMHCGEPVGIAVFTSTHLLLGPRRLALPECYWPENVARHGADALNRDVRLLSRIVVDPRYRGIGIAGKLISTGVRDLAVPYVECLAQMGAFSSFLVSAGFTRVAECAMPKPTRRLRDFMVEHGIALADLLDPFRRVLVIERLGSARDDLTRKLRAVLRMRIETGHGAMRGMRVDPFARPEMLQRMLTRLHAQPSYFLLKA